MEISCVPEYAIQQLKQFVNEIAIDPEDNIYPKGINDTSVDANTMEDGVSYSSCWGSLFCECSRNI